MRPDVPKQGKAQVVLAIAAMLAISCWWNNLKAQTGLSPGQWKSVYIDRISTEQGLSQVTALIAIQDKSGFIWIGTQNGLNRYDGYNMKVYTHQDSDTSSLGGNFIYALFEDKKGHIWIGTRDDGVSCFDPSTETFKNYRHIPNDPNSLSDNFINAIYEDRKGIIWIGSWNGGLNALDPGTGKVTRYMAEPGIHTKLGHKAVSSITEDGNGNLWIGTYGGGLHQLDSQRKDFKRFVNNPANPNSIASNRIISIYKDPLEKDILWIGTIDGGLNRFDISKQLFRSYKKQEGIPYSSVSNRIHGMCTDPYDPDYLWVATWDAGLSLFHKKTGKFTNFGFNIEDPNAVSSNMLFNISADRSGNVWIGSQGGGLNKIDRSKQVFEYWNTQKPGLYHIKGKEISAIVEERSGEGIWIGTSEDGLHYINYKNSTHQHFLELPGTQISLQQHKVHAILEDSKGQIWIGLSGKNVFVRRVGSSTFEPPSEMTCPGIVKLDMRSLFEDSKGQIWAGSLTAGLFRIQSEKNTCTQFINTTERPDIIGSNDILCIHEDPENRLWVGARTGGLNLLDLAKERFIIYKNDPQNPSSLSSNSVNDILSPRQYPNILIIATSGGISLLDLQQRSFNDPSKATFTRVASDKGLTDNTIYTIEEDEKGFFWASTANGLFMLELQQKDGTFSMKVLRYFNKSDGLQNNEFNACASYNNNKGDLFFGGVAGLNIIRAIDIKKEVTKVPVVITRFEQYTKTGVHEVTGIAHKSQLLLRHNENTFSVEFAALNFKNSLKNKYAYKFEGESNDWIELGERRRLTFANLAPGFYTLQIKASYDDGAWGEPLSLRVRIRPPWWRSNLAYLVYLCMLAGVVIALWRYERKRMHIANELKLQASRAEQLKEIDRLKSEFFANISHEFRTPLTLILGPLEQLLEGKFKGNLQQEYALMKANAQRLKKLIDQLLDLSKVDAGKYEIHTQKADIVAFVRSIVSVFNPLATRRRIALVVESEFEHYALFFDPELMENIVLNLLSNAFKFTPDNGRIRINLAEERGHTSVVQFKISVTDSGVGITHEDLPYVFNRFYKAPKSNFEAGTGIGLALVKELVSLHNGNIRAKSELGKGACFEVLLPSIHQDQTDTLLLEQPALSQSGNWTSEFAEEVPQAPAIAVLPSTEKESLPLALVVEDNKDMSRYIQQQLAAQYQLIAAPNGKEGLKMAQEHIPDIIICDLMMPEMNGYELCKKLKADQFCSHIPVILLTAKASGGSKIEGLQAGADDYMVKPFDAKELLARANNLIAQRKQLRALLGSLTKTNGSDQIISPADASLLERLLSVIHENIADEHFDVDQLARQAGFSRAQLYRKVKALTDQSVSEYIQSIRLKRAAELILQQAGNLNEVAYQVGFKDPSYFSKCFRKQFDCLPSEYASKKSNHQ